MIFINPYKHYLPIWNPIYIHLCLELDFIRAPEANKYLGHILPKAVCDMLESNTKGNLFKNKSDYNLFIERHKGVLESFTKEYYLQRLRL